MHRALVRPSGGFVAAFVVALVTLTLIAGLTPAQAASKPPTPPPVSAMPASLPKAKNSEARLQPNTVHLLRLIEHLFPYYAKGGVIGGYRQDPIPDHPSGQALDIMMNNDGRDPASVNDGHRIAAFLMANSTQLGVTYMVWRQNIWYPGREWRELADRGNWTDNHMNHIHVRVEGSFSASNDLALPKDLKVKLDEMPNGEALRKEHELRVALIVRVEKAQERVVAAEDANRRLSDRNSQRAQVLDAARVRVAQAVRESYILGIDSALLSSSLLLMSGSNTDPTISLALERALRSHDEGLTAALGALTVAAKELADNERELRTARDEHETAQAELARLDSAG